MSEQDVLGNPIPELREAVRKLRQALKLVTKIVDESRTGSGYGFAAMEAVAAALEQTKEFEE